MKRNRLLLPVAVCCLALMGSYSAPTGRGATAGTWNTSSGTPTMGTITPKKLTAPGTLAGERWRQPLRYQFEESAANRSMLL